MTDEPTISEALEAILADRTEYIRELEDALIAVNDCCNHDHIDEVAAVLKKINRERDR